MLKLIQRVAIALSSVAALMTVYESAYAQLDVGRYGIQPGLESEYLQYQIQNPNLNQMRVIPGCTVGFGLSCNKTGSVLQKLVELNGGPSYQQLLIQAAGGQENFQKFAGFYGNNPNVSQAPFASFWKNESASIMDGYQYVLGQRFGRTPVEGLGLVTNKFYWSPYTAVDKSPSLRDALVDLKLAYGKLALEEVSKIPNLEQQIRSLALPPDMTKFYLNNLSRGMNALNSGDKNQLQNSIFQILSYPYSENGEELGRPNNAIPQELSQLAGENVPGNILLTENPIALQGEAIGLDTSPGFLGEVLVPEVSGSFPVWPVVGGGALALLLLLLLSGGDSSSDGQSVAPGLTPSPNECIPSPNGNGSGNGSGNGGQVIEVPCKPTTPVTPPEVKKVIEPSMFKALILLVVLLYVLRYKKQSMKMNG